MRCKGCVKNKKNSYHADSLCLNTFIFSSEKPFDFVRTRLLLIFILGSAVQLASQQVQRTLKWDAPRKISISKYDALEMPWFQGAQYLEEPQLAPWFIETIPLARDGGIREAKLENVQWENLSAAEQRILGKTIISEVPILNVDVVYEKRKPQLSMRLLPFRLSQGSIQKIVSFQLSYTLSPAASSNRKLNRNTTTQSVLSNGNWFKVGITNSGIYFISKSQLAAMGMNTEINPLNLRVYGNGGGMLPERNNLYYPDDLIENAVFVKGESDVVFNDGDGILFYAQGPVTWKYDTGKEMFRHTRNLYADTAWYFISADLGPGKRIQNLVDPDAAPTVSASDFEDYAAVENDEENLIITGRRFFGNRMELINEHSFTFSFPNITPGPHKISANLVARGSSATSFSVSASNQAFTQNVNGLNANMGYLDTYAKENETMFQFNASSSNIPVTIKKLTEGGNIGWIDFININVRRNLVLSGSYTAFRTQNLVAPGQIVAYSLSGANEETRIWDITDLYSIGQLNTSFSGNVLTFKASLDTLRQFVAVNYASAQFPSPISGGRLANQNLHGLSQADLIIVAPKNLLAQANVLAQHHRNWEGYSVHVVEDRTIFNEFSSGKADIAGIRNFMRMFYERGTTNEDALKYLLLLGDGTYKPKSIYAGSTNFLPTYQSVESLSPIGSYASDDFFGLLDPTEGTTIQSANAGSLDIGIGRLPASSAEEADAMIDKIIHYSTSTDCMGDWRNILCFVADDEDNSDHVEQAELVSGIISNNHPEFNVDKIYLDAFQQETGAGGQNYPLVNQAINTRVDKGALMINYAGHGGEEGLALERVVTIDQIQEWENYTKLPLFLTATCEFSRFDDPDFTSAGEYVILNPKGGSVALFTTVRLTFSTSNEAINRNVMDTILAKVDGEYQTLGDIFRGAKNRTGSSFNNRSFALLGDPAMKLAYPRYQVVTTAVNGKSAAQFPDTLSALEFVTVEGFVSADGVNPATDFNGILEPTVFDKSLSAFTLRNDPSSTQINFNLQKNIIFKGPASITNGRFTFSFVVPKDIQLEYGLGKISYYARKNGSLLDANGALTNVVVGGFSSNPVNDDKGPEVRLYMNNERFVSGGMTDENPDLFALVEDDFGINTVGTGIGHDITAILDGNTGSPFILNDFFEAELDNYKKGKIRYPFKDLEPGPHTLTLKVWDVANNSSTASIDFVVVENEELALSHVLNYPNPFSTFTQFFFEYNQPGVSVDVEVQIFSVSGKIVKTLRSSQFTSGYRSEPIVWDGRDDYGDKIGRGVYVYRLKVSTEDGKSAEKIEKLVILN